MELSSFGKEQYNFINKVFFFFLPLFFFFFFFFFWGGGGKLQLLKVSLQYKYTQMNTIYYSDFTIIKKQIMFYIHLVLNVPINDYDVWGRKKSR